LPFGVGRETSIMGAKKKLSPNAQRRALVRVADKVARQRERLARLADGGAPDRPIDVISASVVETQAAGQACLRCDASCRVADHAAVTVGERRLRVVRLECSHCGTVRALYFRIVGETLN
jgi:hypothetical protein